MPEGWITQLADAGGPPRPGFETELRSTLERTWRAADEATPRRWRRLRRPPLLAWAVGGVALVALVVGLALVLGSGGGDDVIVTVDPTIPATPTTPSTPIAPAPNTLTEIERYEPITFRGNSAVSPDGTLYIDTEGCIRVIGTDAAPICPDGPSGVDSADWSADSSTVVFDEPAFQFNSDSDIWLATIEREVDDAGRTSDVTVEFTNLTDDGTDDGEAGVIDFLPLLFGDEIRFLRLNDDLTIDIVTIDRAGTELERAATGLSLPRLTSLDTVGVDGRHVLVINETDPGDEPPEEPIWISIARDGSITEHPFDRDVAAVLVPLDTARDEQAAAVAVLAATDAPAPPVLGSGSTPAVPVLVEVLVFDGESFREVAARVGASDGPPTLNAAFDPTGEHLLVADSHDGSGVLLLWRGDTGQTTPLGSVDVGTIVDVRWVAPERAIVFGTDAVVEIALPPL